MSRLLSTILITVMFVSFLLDDYRCEALRGSGTGVESPSSGNRRFYGRSISPSRYSSVDVLAEDEDNLVELNKRQLSDDYGHMRFGKRDQFYDYGHVRFGRNHE